MTLASNFLLHLASAVTLGARIVSMRGMEISWVGNFRYMKWEERKKRVEGKYTLKNWQ